MKRLAVAALLASCVLLPLSTARAEKDVEPVDCVALATSWDAAVAEAKLLNVPIVVHSHGFYCGPCWGLHSSLMCNDKYIEFARENTVEVIALQRLQEGIEEGSQKARRYKGQRRGKEVEFLAEFPGLTAAEMIALAESRAGSYNDTGGIPFTCLVDPHTLSEIQRWQGGGVSAKSLMGAVEEARKALDDTHGEGLPAATCRGVTQAEEDAWVAVAKDDFAKAMATLDKVGRKLGAEAPQALTERIAAARTEMLQRAEERLAEIQTLSAGDPAKAKRELNRLLARLKGTGLEEKAKTLLASI